jgi:hypothetical protein
MALLPTIRGDVHDPERRHPASGIFAGIAVLFHAWRRVIAGSHENEIQLHAFSLADICVFWQSTL